MSEWRTREEVYEDQYDLENLSEQELEQLAQEFTARFDSVQQDYFRRMGQHIKALGELTPSDIHVIQQTQRMNRNLDSIKKQIAKVTNITESDVEDLFVEAAKTDPRIAQITGTKDYDDILSNRQLRRIIEAQARETARNMRNLSNTTVVSAPYKRIIDTAITALTSGTTDYNSAIRSAVKQAGSIGLEVTDKGTTKVEYESGYKRRLDTAARMNVLDGMRHVNQNIINELGTMYGANGIEIDAHPLCAKDHLPYQGKQFTQEDFDAIQSDLPRPFGEWNCRHIWHPIIMGVTQPTYTEEQLKLFEQYSTEEIEIDGKTKTRYEWSQEMRRIETAQRQQRDTRTLAKQCNDGELQKTCTANIKALWDKYDRITPYMQFDRTKFDAVANAKL